jgi:hypothetical protein
MMKKLFLIISVFWILSSCSDKTSKPSSNTPAKPYYPWKTVSFKGLFTISCPDEWKVRRDKARLFVRQKEGYPFGVVIGVETSRYLNNLAPNKYFLYFYKNVALPNSIKISGLSDYSLSGLNAISLGYTFKQGDGKILKGKKYIVKHDGRFIFIVTESPIEEYSRNYLKLKWIIDSMKFSGVNYTAR